MTINFNMSYLLQICNFLYNSKKPALIGRGTLAQNLYLWSMKLTSAMFTSAMTNLIPAITFILAVLFKYMVLLPLIKTDSNVCFFVYFSDMMIRFLLAGWRASGFVQFQDKQRFWEHQWGLVVPCFSHSIREQRSKFGP